MSSNRCVKLLSIIAGLLVLGACGQMPGAASPPDQTVGARPAGGACQGDDGPIADGTIVAKCVVSGQGMTGCPRYVCRRCGNGQWSGEYSCRVQ